MLRRRQLTRTGPPGANSSSSRARRVAADIRESSSALPPVSEKPNPRTGWKLWAGSRAITASGECEVASCRCSSTRRSAEVIQVVSVPVSAGVPVMAMMRPPDGIVRS